MSEYKVIFKATSDNACNSQTTWEQGCPLLMKAVQVSRNTTTGDAYLQMRIKNISSHLAISFHARFEIYSPDGSSEFHEINPLDADIAPGAEFIANPIHLELGNIASVNALIDSVNLESSKWRSTADACPSPKPIQSEMQEAALAERQAQLASQGVPRSAQTNIEFQEEDEWWMCLCGQVNTVDRNNCCNCGARLETLKSISAMSETELIESSKARLAQDAKIAAETKKRRFRLISVASAVLTLAIIGFSINAFVLEPDKLAHTEFPAFAGFKLGDASSSYPDYPFNPKTTVNGVKGTVYINSLKNNRNADTIKDIEWISSNSNGNPQEIVDTAHERILAEMERMYGPGKTVTVPKGTTGFSLEKPCEGTQFITKSGIIYLVGPNSEYNIDVYQISDPL